MKAAVNLDQSPRSLAPLHLPIVESAEWLRHQIAARRDCLVGRQRRRYDAARQAEIDRLGEEHRIVLDLALRYGLEAR